MTLLKTYGIFGIIQLLSFKLRGFLVFRNARIIRFPFRVRGKEFIKVGIGFTTGFNCRLDAFNLNNVNHTLINIGDNVEINDDVHIAAVERVDIGDNVLIASKVYLSDHNHGIYKGDFQDTPVTPPGSRKIYSAPVKIEKNVWIGEFVAVLQGVTIGEGSIIGAMSVVTKDIPPYSIAVGSPAKVIKTFDCESKKWIAKKNQML